MKENKPRRVIFFVRRIGPYHHARFQEASKLLDLVVVETRSASQEYTWEFLAKGSYKIERLPLSSNPESGLHGNDLTNAIVDIFNRHDTDVVVTTGWADQEYHAVVLEASQRNIPRIVISDSRFEDEPRKFYKELLKKLILKSYSSALVAGTSARNYLLKLGFRSQSIFQPWDVVDNDHFHSKSAPATFNERYFLCVSRFIPKKNLETLIDSYASYRKEGGKRKLVLAGSGELEPRLRAQASAPGPGDYLDMPGFVQYDALPELYSRALCLIFPSTSDQWGLVVNEAMAAGLPVIVSSNCGCAGDLVKESENGFIFDPFNGAELTRLLLQMDSVGEKAWMEMSEKSKLQISNWGLGQFARGLASAVDHAVEHPRSAISFIHKILAR